MRDYSLSVELHHSEPPGAPRELQDLGRAVNVLARRMNSAFEQSNLLLDEQERLSGELGCAPNDAPHSRSDATTDWWIQPDSESLEYPYISYIYGIASDRIGCA